METHKHNLIELVDNREINVLIHPCNCFHDMESGVAKQLKDNYPEVYEADLKTIKGDKDKLGRFSFADVARHLRIINAYTQYYNDNAHVNFSAIREVFSHIGFIYRCSSSVLGIAPIVTEKSDSHDHITAIIDEELRGCKYVHIEIPQ